MEMKQSCIQIVRNNRPKLGPDLGALPSNIREEPVKRTEKWMAPRIIPDIRHYFARVRKNTVFTTIGGIFNKSRESNNALRLSWVCCNRVLSFWSRREICSQPLWWEAHGFIQTNTGLSWYIYIYIYIYICMLLVKTISRNEHITHSVTHRPRTGVGAFFSICCILGPIMYLWH
jgi:hypothetical protein